MIALKNMLSKLFLLCVCIFLGYSTAQTCDTLPTLEHAFVFGRYDESHWNLAPLPFNSSDYPSELIFGNPAENMVPVTSESIFGGVVTDPNSKADFAIRFNYPLSFAQDWAISIWMTPSAIPETNLFSMPVIRSETNPNKCDVGLLTDTSGSANPKPDKMSVLTRIHGDCFHTTLMDVSAPDITLESMTHVFISNTGGTFQVRVNTTAKSLNENAPLIGGTELRLANYDGYSFPKTIIHSVRFYSGHILNCHASQIAATTRPSARIASMLSHTVNIFPSQPRSVALGGYVARGFGYAAPLTVTATIPQGTSGAGVCVQATTDGAPNALKVGDSVTVTDTLIMTADAASSAGGCSMKLYVIPTAGSLHARWISTLEGSVTVVVRPPAVPAAATTTLAVAAGAAQPTAEGPLLWAATPATTESSELVSHVVIASLPLDSRYTLHTSTTAPALTADDLPALLPVGTAVARFTQPAMTLSGSNPAAWKYPAARAPGDASAATSFSYALRTQLSVGETDQDGDVNDASVQHTSSEEADGLIFAKGSERFTIDTPPLSAVRIQRMRVPLTIKYTDGEAPESVRIVLTSLPTSGKLYTSDAYDAAPITSLASNAPVPNTLLLPKNTKLYYEGDPTASSDSFSCYGIGEGSRSVSPVADFTVTISEASAALSQAETLWTWGLAYDADTAAPRPLSHSEADAGTAPLFSAGTGSKSRLVFSSAAAVGSAAGYSARTPFRGVDLSTPSASTCTARSALPVPAAVVSAGTLRASATGSVATNGLTVELWLSFSAPVAAKAVTTEAPMPVMVVGTSTDCSDAAVAVFASRTSAGGQLLLSLRLRGDDHNCVTTTNTITLAADASAVAAFALYHVVFTVNTGSNRVNGFLNGKYAFSESIASFDSAGMTGSFLLLGAVSSAETCTTESFTGTIVTLAMYLRALEKHEISANSRLASPQPRPVAAPAPDDAATLLAGAGSSIDVILAAVLPYYPVSALQARYTALPTAAALAVSDAARAGQSGYDPRADTGITGNAATAAVRLTAAGSFSGACSANDPCTVKITLTRTAALPPSATETLTLRVVLLDERPPVPRTRALHAPGPAPGLFTAALTADPAAGSSTAVTALTVTDVACTGSATLALKGGNALLVGSHGSATGVLLQYTAPGIIKVSGNDAVLGECVVKYTATNANGVQSSPETTATFTMHNWLLPLDVAVATSAGEPVSIVTRLDAAAAGSTDTSDAAFIIATLPSLPATGDPAKGELRCVPAGSAAGASPKAVTAAGTVCAAGSGLTYHPADNEVSAAAGEPAAAFTYRVYSPTHKTVSAVAAAVTVEVRVGDPVCGASLLSYYDLAEPYLASPNALPGSSELALTDGLTLVPSTPPVCASAGAGGGNAVTAAFGVVRTRPAVARYAVTESPHYGLASMSQAQTAAALSLPTGAPMPARMPICAAVSDSPAAVTAPHRGPAFALPAGEGASTATHSYSVSAWVSLPDKISKAQELLSITASPEQAHFTGDATDSVDGSDIEGFVATPLLVRQLASGAVAVTASTATTSGSSTASVTVEVPAASVPRSGDPFLLTVTLGRAGSSSNAPLQLSVFINSALVGSPEAFPASVSRVAGWVRPVLCVGTRRSVAGTPATVAYDGFVHTLSVYRGALTQEQVRGHWSAIGGLAALISRALTVRAGARVPIQEQATEPTALPALIEAGSSPFNAAATAAVVLAPAQAGDGVEAEWQSGVELQVYAGSDALLTCFDIAAVNATGDATYSVTALPATLPVGTISLAVSAAAPTTTAGCGAPLRLRLRARAPGAPAGSPAAAWGGEASVELETISQRPSATTDITVEGPGLVPVRIRGMGGSLPADAEGAPEVDSVTIESVPSRVELTWAAAESDAPQPLLVGETVPVSAAVWATVTAAPQGIAGEFTAPGPSALGTVDIAYRANNAAGAASGPAGKVTVRTLPWVRVDSLPLGAAATKDTDAALELTGTDLSGGPDSGLTYIITTLPSAGSLLDPSGECGSGKDGVVSSPSCRLSAAAAAALRYRPPAGQSDGADGQPLARFTYTACHAVSGVCAPALRSVTVSVAAVPLCTSGSPVAPPACRPPVWCVESPATEGCIHPPVYCDLEAGITRYCVTAPCVTRAPNAPTGCTPPRAPLPQCTGSETPKSHFCVAARVLKPLSHWSFSETHTLPSYFPAEPVWGAALAAAAAGTVAFENHAAVQSSQSGVHALGMGSFAVLSASSNGLNVLAPAASAYVQFVDPATSPLAGLSFVSAPSPAAVSAAAALAAASQTGNAPVGYVPQGGFIAGAHFRAQTPAAAADAATSLFADAANGVSVALWLTIPALGGTFTPGHVMTLGSGSYSSGSKPASGECSTGAFLHMALSAPSGSDSRPVLTATAFFAKPVSGKCSLSVSAPVPVPTPLSATDSEAIASHIVVAVAPVSGGGFRLVLTIDGDDNNAAEATSATGAAVAVTALNKAVLRFAHTPLTFPPSGGSSAPKGASFHLNGASVYNTVISPAEAAAVRAQSAPLRSPALLCRHRTKDAPPACREPRYCHSSSGEWQRGPRAGSSIGGIYDDDGPGEGYTWDWAAITTGSTAWEWGSKFGVGLKPEAVRETLSGLYCDPVSLCDASKGEKPTSHFCHPPAAATATIAATPKTVLAPGAYVASAPSTAETRFTVEAASRSALAAGAAAQNAHGDAGVLHLGLSLTEKETDTWFFGYTLSLLLVPPATNAPTTGVAELENNEEYDIYPVYLTALPSSSSSSGDPSVPDLQLPAGAPLHSMRAEPVRVNRTLLARGASSIQLLTVYLPKATAAETLKNVALAVVPADVAARAEGMPVLSHAAALDQGGAVVRSVTTPINLGLTLRTTISKLSDLSLISPPPAASAATVNALPFTRNVALSLPLPGDRDGTSAPPATGGDSGVLAALNGIFGLSGIWGLMLLLLLVFIVIVLTVISCCLAYRRSQRLQMSSSSKSESTTTTTMMKKTTKKRRTGSSHDATTLTTGAAEEEEEVITTHTTHARTVNELISADASTMTSEERAALVAAAKADGMKLDPMQEGMRREAVLQAQIERMKKQEALIKRDFAEDFSGSSSSSDEENAVKQAANRPALIATTGSVEIAPPSAAASTADPDASVTAVPCTAAAAAGAAAGTGTGTGTSRRKSRSERRRSVAVAGQAAGAGAAGPRANSRRRGSVYSNSNNGAPNNVVVQVAVHMDAPAAVSAPSVITLAPAAAAAPAAMETRMIALPAGAGAMAPPVPLRPAQLADCAHLSVVREGDDLSESEDQRSASSSKLIVPASPPSAGSGSFRSGSPSHRRVCVLPALPPPSSSTAAIAYVPAYSQDSNWLFGHSNESFKGAEFESSRRDSAGSSVVAAPSGSAPVSAAPYGGKSTPPAAPGAAASSVAAAPASARGATPAVATENGKIDHNAGEEEDDGVPYRFTTPPPSAAAGATAGRSTAGSGFAPRNTLTPHRDPSTGRPLLRERADPAPAASPLGSLTPAVGTRTGSRLPPPTANSGAPMARQLLFAQPSAASAAAAAAAGEETEDEEAMGSYRRPLHGHHSAPTLESSSPSGWSRIHTSFAPPGGHGSNSFNSPASNAGIASNPANSNLNTPAGSSFGGPGGPAAPALRSTVAGTRIAAITGSGNVGRSPAGVRKGSGPVWDMADDNTTAVHPEEWEKSFKTPASSAAPTPRATPVLFAHAPSTLPSGGSSHSGNSDGSGTGNGNMNVSGLHPMQVSRAPTTQDVLESALSSLSPVERVSHMEAMLHRTLKEVAPPAYDFSDDEASAALGGSSMALGDISAVSPLQEASGESEAEAESERFSPVETYDGMSPAPPVVIAAAGVSAPAPIAGARAGGSRRNSARTQRREQRETNANDTALDSDSETDGFGGETSSPPRAHGHGHGHGHGHYGGGASAGAIGLGHRVRRPSLRVPAAATCSPDSLAVRSMPLVAKETSDSGETSPPQGVSSPATAPAAEAPPVSAASLARAQPAPARPAHSAADLGQDGDENFIDPFKTPAKPLAPAGNAARGEGEVSESDGEGVGEGEGEMDNGEEDEDEDDGLDALRTVAAARASAAHMVALPPGGVSGASPGDLFSPPVGAGDHGEDEDEEEESQEEEDLPYGGGAVEGSYNFNSFSVAPVSFADLDKSIASMRSGERSGE